jgi:hypothetical protein
MKTFVIDSANSMKAYASSETARKCRDGTRFATEKDFGSGQRTGPCSGSSRSGTNYLA